MKTKALRRLQMIQRPASRLLTIISITITTTTSKHGYKKIRKNSRTCVSTFGTQNKNFGSLSPCQLFTSTKSYTPHSGLLVTAFHIVRRSPSRASSQMHAHTHTRLSTPDSLSSINSSGNTVSESLVMHFIPTLFIPHISTGPVIPATSARVQSLSIREFSFPENFVSVREPRRTQ